MVYLSLLSRIRLLELFQVKVGGGAARTRHTSRPVPPISAQDARNLLMSLDTLTASVKTNREHEAKPGLQVLPDGRHLSALSSAPNNGVLIHYI